VTPKSRVPLVRRCREMNGSFAAASDTRKTRRLKAGFSEGALDR
jgi:hypothetical protein